MSDIQRITTDPNIFGGKPIVRGRRLAVEHVLSMLDAGDTAESILAAYDWLEPEDIAECLRWRAGQRLGEQLDKLRAAAAEDTTEEGVRATIESELADYYAEQADKNRSYSPMVEVYTSDGIPSDVYIPLYDPKPNDETKIGYMGAVYAPYWMPKFKSNENGVRIEMTPPDENGFRKFKFTGDDPARVAAFEEWFWDAVSGDERSVESIAPNLVWSAADDVAVEETARAAQEQVPYDLAAFPAHTTYSPDGVIKYAAAPFNNSATAELARLRAALTKIADDAEALGMSAIADAIREALGEGGGK